MGTLMENQNVVGQCMKCHNNMIFCICKEKGLPIKYEWTTGTPSLWNRDKVIDFVNWYIEMKDLGENNKLENATIVESFLKGDSPNVWKEYGFLLDRFHLYEEGIYRSNDTWIVGDLGSDSKLYIAVGNGTNIWWRANRGLETTIFEGRSLKTEEEFNTVFELLDIKTFLKWK